MGGCESQQNIHLGEDENNMNGTIPAAVADVGSPLFGPEATNEEEVANENNEITVMATMVGETADTITTANVLPSANGAQGEYVDETTGERFVYYDSLDAAQRAAGTSDVGYGAETQPTHYGGHYAQHSEMHYSGKPQTYAEAEQATVSVPVTAHHQEEAQQEVDYQASQPQYGSSYHEEAAYQGGDYQAPQPHYGSHHEEPVDYQGHHQPQYGARRPVYEAGPVAYDSQPQYDEHAEHHEIHEEEQAVVEEEQVVEEQQVVSEVIDTVEVSDEEADEKKNKDKKKKKKRSWRNWM